MDVLTASSRKLQDFDWSVKLALSSDKLTGLQKPILQLQLYIDQPNHKSTSDLVELNTEELNALLNSLKAAQLALSKK